MGSFFKYFAIAAFIALFAIIYQGFFLSSNLQKITEILTELVILENNHGIDFKTYKPRVVIGYGSCSDLNVRAIEFLNYTESLADFKERNIEDDEIHTKEDFLRSFMYYFSQGAAAERYTPNSALFKNLVQQAKKQQSARWILGGNAPLMGTRFFLEGAEVLIGATMSTKQRTLLMEGVELIDFEESDEFVDDIHLILEYKTGDKFGEHIAPRANRYIIHHDVNNPMIKSLDLLDVNGYKPNLFVVSGMQMLDNFPFKDPSIRTDRLKKAKLQMTQADPSTLIHFEMASFVETELVNELLENIIPYSDSLGMNEQEIDNLVHMLETKKISLSADANPRISTTLDMMRKLFKYQNRNYYASRKTDNKLRLLSRIHIHTLAFQLILNVRGSKWRKIKNAAAKSSLIAHRHVCEIEYVNPESVNLILDNSFATSNEAHETDVRPKRINFKQTNVPCWNETITLDGSNSLDVEICISPVLVCKVAKRTVGAGDNISAAGLILQI